MSNPYRRPSIDTSYQVLDHWDKWFQRRRFKCEKLMDDKRIQTVPIATNVVSLNSAHGKVYLMQNYVTTVASDIRQVGGVLQVLLFPQLIKIDHHNMAELLLKVALITINLTR
jgi:hypothetical protein